MNQTDKQALEQGPIAFLAAGGEMGERIRAFDWSKTPLGPISQWPQSLKAAVPIMLNSRYPMFIWWGQEITNLYNDAYIPVLGKRHPEALGRRAADVWTDVWPVVGPQAEVVLNEGRATWNEETLLIMERNQFLEETYFTFSYSPVPDDEGNVGGVFCVCTEETERVLSQRRLRTLGALAEQAAQAKTAEEACQLAALTLAENQYDLPFVLLYLLDDEGQRAKLTALAGLEAHTALSPTVIDLKESDMLWPFDEVIATGKSVEVYDLPDQFGPLPGGAWPESAQQVVVLPMARPSQTQLAGFVVAGVSPRLAFNDEYRGFMSLLASHVATAVANARAYEEERQRAEALADLDRAKTTFFSNVSHEFRTPLTLMLAPVQELLEQRRDDLTPTAKEQLEIVHRNTLRLLKMVNIMLDFSRIEAGRIQANYEPVDLAVYTAELASVFRSAIKQAGLQLIVNCPPLSEPVYVDRDMWEKIVLNLLSNALKFTTAGEIEVRLTEADGQVHLTVRDTGVGIPAEELTRIFERFHQVKESRGRTYEGTGIGLALVQELVKLHGGTVHVESILNSGSQFVVSVPLGKAHLDAERIAKAPDLPSTHTRAEAFIQEALRWLPPAIQEQQAAQIEGKESSPVLPGIDGGKNGNRPRSPQRARIIWADDNADMREYVSRLLGERFDVEALSDGQAALEAARANPPDLILSDVMMSKLDGFGLLQTLREDPHLRRVPFILLSARAGEEARIEGLQAGADDYLIKPFSARELLASIEAHLRMARVRQKAEAAMRESERRYRQIVQGLPSAIYTTDAQGYITLYNDAAVALWGRTPVIERDMWCGSWRIYRPDGTVLPLDECPMALTLREGRSVRGEIIIERPDGTRINVLPYPEPFFDEDGEIVGAVNMLVDITERKRGEQALRDSEAQYRGLAARLKGLLEITSRLIETLETKELLSSLLALAREMVAVDALGLWRQDAQGEWGVVASSGLSDEFIHESLSGIKYAAPPVEPLVIQPEVLADRSTPMLQHRWERYEREGIRSLMILPLTIHGKIAGTLVFYSRSAYTFTEVDVEAAQALANIAAAAITTSELYEAQSRLRQMAEEAAVRESFLATAGAILSKSLDYEQTLTNVAQVAVPHFADWCAVDLLDSEGVLDRLAVAHVDQRKLALAHELHEKYPPDMNAPGGVPHVIRTGESELVQSIPDELIVQAAGEDTRLLYMLRELQLTSYICVPLQAGSHVYGAITFVAAESKHIFEEQDLKIAQEIARRAAQAIDNARLYRDLGESERRFRDIFETVGVSVWVEDFTEVMAAVDELRAQGISDFRAYFEQHPDFVRQAIELVRLVDVNQETLAIFRAPNKSDLLRSLNTIFTPEAETIFIEELITLAEGRETMRAEVPLRTLDGRPIAVLFSVHFNPHTDDYSRVVVTLTDITLHKKAEQALRESEQRFKTMADTAPAMIWITDQNNECTFLSRGWYEYTGQTTAEGLGFGWTNAVHPEDQKQATQKFLMVTESPQAFRVDYRLRRADGQYRWAIDAGRPRFSDAGEFLGYIGSVIDIHERKQTEEELYRLNEELEERVVERTNELERQNRRLRQLANQLTEAEQRERRKLARTLHDGLQQLLIAGKIQLRLFPQNENLKAIKHLEELFDEAIGVSRSLSYELSPPALHSFDLPVALQWLGRWFQTNHHFDVELQVSEDFPVVLNHAKTFLFDAIRELLLNAVKHSGGETALVELHYLHPQRVSIIVSDEGQGFDPDQLEREDEILQGIGLFSIRERLAALGGTFRIDSTPGKGAKFTLILPLTEMEKQLGPGDAIPSATMPVSHAKAHVKVRPIRVLIVDDHHIVRKGLVSLLEHEEDIEVVGEASDGVEAIERAEELRPTVVVMDIDMPRMDGIEATSRIKRKHPEIVIITLSLHEEPDKMEGMRRAGTSAYIRKGGDAETLLKTIRDLC